MIHAFSLSYNSIRSKNVKGLVLPIFEQYVNKNQTACVLLYLAQNYVCMEIHPGG